jgi:nucleolar protein 53
MGHRSFTRTPYTDPVRTQAPDVPHPRAVIALPAVPAPHAGTTYNPPEVAHTTLLRTAHEAELRRPQEAEMLEATKACILGTRNVGGGEAGVLGMLVDKPGDEPAEAEREPESDNNTGVPRRKTKQQRRKAVKLCAEVC